VNDKEEDGRSRLWSNSLSSLLQPPFPSSSSNSTTILESISLRGSKTNNNNKKKRKGSGILILGEVNGI